MLSGTVCVPFGLRSVQGKLLNGQLGEVRDVDHGTRRISISFDPRHPPAAWKKILQTQLRILCPIQDDTQTLGPCEACHCLSLQPSDWQVKISPALRIHEKMFLACANRFFYNEMIPPIRQELTACQDASRKSNDLNDDSDGSVGSHMDREGAITLKQDTKMLYRLATSMLLPPRSVKVLQFDAKPRLGKLPKLPMNFRRETMRNNEVIERQYEKYFQGMLKTHRITGTNWRPEAINDEVCKFREKIKPVLESGMPFSVTFVRNKNMDEVFKERCASQGGPILVTGMHLAARLGDTSICSMMHRLGAAVNPNMLIPNDQHSQGGEPNRTDGRDFSQYRWGLVTPMRLACTFGNVTSTAWFRRNGGELGSAQHTHLPGRDPSPNLAGVPMMGSSFARMGAPGFSHLPEGLCWTNAEENVVYYLNTYMDGERLYPNVLYESEYHGPGSLMLDRIQADDSSSDTTEQVIQECVHDEPAVVPDAADNIVADMLWGQRVEQDILLSEATSSPAPVFGLAVQPGGADMIWMEDSADSAPSADMWKPDSTNCSDRHDKIYIVKFSRSVKDLFPAKLHTGRELEPVRAAAEESGQKCLLKSGASIFVYPNQYSGILSVLKDYALRRHHVVVSEAFLPLIYQEIVSIPSKSNIKPVDWKLFALVDDDYTQDICVVERSFFHSSPAQLHAPEDVTQSTSEVHHVLNVRRLHLA